MYFRNKKIVKFEDEFKNFGNVNKSNITKVSKQIFSWDKLSIFIMEIQITLVK